MYQVLEREGLEYLWAEPGLELEPHHSAQEAQEAAEQRELEEVVELPERLPYLFHWVLVK